jgi:Cof subfamily protein (haloacid dehalogenase superfamily)
MKYKAIIFDLDGTAMEMSYDAVPSTAVVEAVRKAKEKVVVAFATGRPLSYCKKINDRLKISNPCVVSGGTEVVNPQTGEILWTKIIEKNDVQKIVDICKSYPYKIIFSKETHRGILASERKVESNENVIYIMNTDLKDAHEIVNKINSIGSVVAHEAGSWIKGMVDIHVTHKDASKKNALIEWLKILNLKKEDVIAVGDNKNDLPLFEEAGFKVAVGNATDELKEKADYVAPSVYEDGLADVINEFILKI